MKKLILVFTLLLCCLGCEKDDDTNNTSGSILGTWGSVNGSFTETITSIYIDPVYGTEIVNTEIINEQTYDYSTYSVSFTYRYDNTYVRNNCSLDSEGSPFDCETTIDDYTKIGNTLRIEPWSSLYNVDFIITTLNDNYLSYNGTFEYQEWTSGDTTFIRRGYEEADMIRLTDTTLDYEFLRETYYNGDGDTTLFTRLVGVGSYSSSSIPQ